MRCIMRPMLGSSAHVKVRRSKAADAAALARVFRDSWLHAYRGIIPHLHLENLVQRRGVGWWRSALRAQEPILALEVGGALGGYATFGTARTRCPYQGEIYELYLTPNFQGLGLGEYLFEACRYELDMRRLDGLLVWA